MVAIAFAFFLPPDKTDPVDATDIEGAHAQTYFDDGRLGDGRIGDLRGPSRWNGGQKRAASAARLSRERLRSLHPLPELPGHLS